MRKIIVASVFHLLAFLASLDAQAQRPFELEEGKVISKDGSSIITYVEIPLSLVAWKEYADRNQLAYEIEEGKISSGATACAHSPICALVVPVAILGSLAESNKRYIVNGEIDGYRVSISYHYQSKHFLYASVGKLDEDFHIKAESFPALKTTYLYYEDKQKVIEGAVGKLAHEYLSQVGDESLKIGLVNDLRYFYEDIEDYMDTFLLENAYGGAVRAVFLERACSQILDEKYKGALSKINRTMDREAAFELLSCLDENRFMGYTSVEVKESAKLSFNQFCLHSKDVELVDVDMFKVVNRTFQHSQELDALVRKCNYKDLNLLWSYENRSELSRDEFIYLYRKDKTYRDILSQSVPEKAKNNPNIISAKLALELEGRFYGVGFYDEAFANLNDEILLGLLSIYFADLHNSKKILFSRVDDDVGRQARLLARFNEMSDDNKRLAVSLISELNRKDDISKLAIYYVLGYEAEFELEKKVLYREKDSLSIPKFVSEVSEKVTEEGEISTDLAYFALHVSGVSERDIKVKFEKINGPRETTSDKIKKLIPL